MVMKHLETHKMTEIDPNVYNLKININGIKSLIKVKSIKLDQKTKSNKMLFTRHLRWGNKG